MARSRILLKIDALYTDDYTALYLAVFNAEHNILSVMSKSMNTNRNAASAQHGVHSTLRGTIENFLNWLC